MDIAIEQAKAATPEIAALLDALNLALAGYSSEQRHALSVEQLFRPNIRFFVVRIGGGAVACGGIGFHDGYAELTRMYSKATVRGRGVAKALLARLEAEARAADVGLVRIETGIHQHEALRFYDALGYRRRGPFGPYADMPATAIDTSLFYEKSI
ncbi:MAG TPA: GNAT family N-acetyltransferase, partial [Dongiaceae bacterium]